MRVEQGIHFLEMDRFTLLGSRAVDGKRFLESNASSILGTLT